MSLRVRLNFWHALILLLVFALFSGVVYGVTQRILLEAINDELLGYAEQVADDIDVNRGMVTALQFPEEDTVFDAAAILMIAIDEQGQITPLSRNLQALQYQQRLDDAPLGNENQYNIVMRDGLRVQVLTAPLFTVEENPILIGHLQVARNLKEYDRTLSNMGWMLLWATVVAILLSLLLGDWSLLHRVLRPLHEIQHAAAAISETGDLGQRVPDTGRNDEIGRLAFALNHAFAQLEGAFQSQQRFLADISHELRTPLTTIRGNVDLIRRLGTADEESLQDIQLELERMTRLVEDLLLLARADAGSLPMSRQPVQLDVIFAEVYRQFSRLDEPIRLTMGGFDQVRVLGDPDRLKQLLINLVSNAIKYTPAGGTVTMSLEQADGFARLEVRDTGVGIEETELPFLFDRFYQVDKSRNSRGRSGTGLGLAIVKWIAEAHEGRVQVASELGEGTVFIITIPLYQKPPSATQIVQEKARRWRMLQRTRSGYD